MENEQTLATNTVVANSKAMQVHGSCTIVHRELIPISVDIPERSREARIAADGLCRCELVISHRRISS